MAEVTKINFKGTVLDIRDANAARASDLAEKQDVISDLASLRRNSNRGVADVSSNQDGTVVMQLSNGDSYTIDLNHEHQQYQRLLTAGANITIAENAQTGEIVISSSGGGSAALTGVSFNGVPATVVNGVATITATIPANVSELNNDSGYVKYVLLADEAAYTALATKDSGTLYLIPES